MAEHSGFFDALKDANGVRDRKYKSADYCSNLAAIISNGVVRSTLDDLRVTANGLSVTVGKGRAWIDGHWYYNDNEYAFDAVTAPTGNARYDRVFLRFDDNIEQRKTYLVYRQGTAAQSPAKPAPVREGKIYELVLADVYVAPSATSVVVTDTRPDANLCGWVYSTAGDNSFFKSLDGQFDVWFEEKKDTLATTTVEVEYKQFTVLTSQSKTVQITIPQYDETVNQKLTVYVNGVRADNPTDYTVAGNTITFTSSVGLIAGTEVTIYITIAKDGTGIPSVVDDVADLQNRVYSLENGLNESTNTYFCNGATDNVEISNIVSNFLSGGWGYGDYGTLTIKIYGKFGATAPVQGAGTSTSPYLWFTAGEGQSKTRRVYLDFGGCSQITLPTGEDGKYYTVFYGLETYIKNCNLVANGAGAYINMFSSPAATVNYCEDCRFWVTALSGYISRGGTFKNCRISYTATAGDAYIFNVLSGGLCRVFGGEYYCYAPTGNIGTVVYVNAAQTNAVIITYGMNCPENARNGYEQTYAINCLTASALCSFTDTITTLPITAAGQNIRGTIAISKAGLM